MTTRSIIRHGGNTRVKASELALLRAAFENFETTTRQMEAAYRALEQRFHEISVELERANSELARKVSELDRTTRSLNHLLDSMPCGVIAVDCGGKVTTFNRAGARIFEVSTEKWIGEPYEKFRAAYLMGCEGLLYVLEGASGFHRVEERVVRTASGALRTLQCHLSPTCDGEGEVTGAVEVFQDITELKQLRERVNQADKLAALGQMAARLAHEIRNPLNGIEGFASLLERDLDPGDERRRFAHNIVRGVRDLNRAVTDVLSYAQNRPIMLRPTPLRAVVERAVMFVAQDLSHQGARDIRISENAGSEVLVLADPDQLQRAVLNVLLNAVQSTGRDGRVEIAIRRDDGSDERPVVLEISDNGCGMSAEVLGRLFEPFFTTKPTGTGLGLAVSRQIIERHRGAIDVRSEPGKGTTFRIRLPAAPGPGDLAEARWANTQTEATGGGSWRNEIEFSQVHSPQRG